MTPLTSLTPLTAAEEEALNAVKAAREAINRPWHTLTMVQDYCCLPTAAFCDALQSLVNKGLILLSGGQVMLPREPQTAKP